MLTVLPPRELFQVRVDRQLYDVDSLDVFRLLVSPLEGLGGMVVAVIVDKEGDRLQRVPYINCIKLY